MFFLFKNLVFTKWMAAPNTLKFSFLWDHVLHEIFLLTRVVYEIIIIMSKLNKKGEVRSHLSKRSNE